MLVPLKSHLRIWITVLAIMFQSHLIAKGGIVELPGLWFGWGGNFGIVLGALEYYEKGKCEGVIVKFDENHCFFDPEFGSNWWEYYFEPIQVGQTIEQSYLSLSSTKQQVKFTLRARWSMPIKYANELIRKYIHIKPALLQEIDDYKKANFDGYHMIGVHYRGTDKFHGMPEAEFISYESMFQIIDAACHKAKTNKKRYKLFIATDEQDFLEAAISRYGNMAVFCDQIRSTSHTGVHNLSEKNNYLKGKEALIDCVLLSKCSELIRTSSNLSACSVYFNPKIKLTNVNYPDSVLWKSRRKP